MDGWPPVNTKRFDGESEGAFRLRSARISQIITAFRSGRYDPRSGDELERELEMLQTPSHREAMASQAR